LSKTHFNKCTATIAGTFSVTIATPNSFLVLGFELDSLIGYVKHSLITVSLEYFCPVRRCSFDPKVFLFTFKMKQTNKDEKQMKQNEENHKDEKNAIIDHLNTCDIPVETQAYIKYAQKAGFNLIEEVNVDSRHALLSFIKN
jgi:hypothetical protein